MQRTWDAIINAPVTLDDLILGEAIWSATRLFSRALRCASLRLRWARRFTLALWSCRGYSSGLAFSGWAGDTRSRDYDFFMYYSRSRHADC